MKLRTKLIIAFVVVMIFPVTFALIAMHAFVPGRGAEIQQLYLIAVVLTTAFLILWIYRSVSVPLEKLQRAARNIKEGNLDFEIKAESNDEIGQLCQDFEEMRRGDYLYVDKTDIVWQLANGDKYNFLSRPRRFGKSLLCSTLKCYFEGRKELFEGLKIMQVEDDWVKRPVIYLSMSLGGSSAQELREYLHNVLSSYEKIYGKNPDERSLGNRLNGIIQRAYEQFGVKIAVIVDEYDVPLQHTYETNQHDECREIYRNFFTGLKDYGYCIKCVFITGITKFTQISLFSMLNTLTNVSFDEQYSAICGLTHDELVQYYSEEISKLASRYDMEVSQVLSELKATYDGYHFSRKLQNVYNPFSMLNALSRSQLNSYWIATGSNEILNNLSKKYVDEIPSLDGCLIDADYLEMSDVNMEEPKLFLYQSGYLTIKAVRGDYYILGYPNKEVKKACLKWFYP